MHDDRFQAAWEADPTDLTAVQVGLDGWIDSDVNAIRNP